MTETIVPDLTAAVVQTMVEPVLASASDVLLADVVAFLHWAFPGHAKLPPLPVKAE